MFKPRPKQVEVLQYRQGRMGVSAVPGSGKTHTLSCLAAELISTGAVRGEQEVLVVTLVNSAVDHFAHRVAAFMMDRGLMPRIGYRIRTLHGLAHDIVRERPELAGLSETFQIVDDRARDQIIRGACEVWLQGHAELLDDFLHPDVDANRIENVRRYRWPDLVIGLATNFIRTAKDIQISPAQLQVKLERLKLPYPLLKMGSDIFADYQQALHYRGGVDFDDLIVMALRALRADSGYLERLRERWPYVLEDEAQDSSRLQEQILRKLVGPEGNWVRVGDPNQAIFETFTTASPQYLRDFLAEADVQARELPNSGRSTLSILSLANYLIDWTMYEHPRDEVRGALTLPYIEPTPTGDPQPNPADRPDGIRLVDLAYTPAEEVTAIGKSLSDWLPDNADQTVAVLVPTNNRGFQIVGELKERGIPYIEILRSSRSTRETAGALTLVLKHLHDPISARDLAKAYQVWDREARQDPKRSEVMQRGAQLLRKCGDTEAFLWPRTEMDWLEGQKASEAPEVVDVLDAFRVVDQRWHRAALLPIDQLILTLSQDLFREAEDLALAYKLASILRRAQEVNLDWDLGALSNELSVIAKNERRFIGFSAEDLGFDPDKHRGKVVVATVHKAKGLEWDRVYLASVNNYDFPSGLAHDQYIAEKWFVRDSLNLDAEALAQLSALVEMEAGFEYAEGAATSVARLDYVSERLRLLYVGITRAKKELVMTWNTGRRGDQQQAAPFIALQSYWESEHDEAAG
ncbi:MAG: ATP-dependent helicase [Anaerolineales bacterium]